MFLRFNYNSAFHVARLFFSTNSKRSTSSDLTWPLLNSYTKKALSKIGYEQMTPIQKSILQQPFTDLCLKAEKSTGRTTGYLIKAIEASNADDLVLVVSPNHESAAYVADQARKLTQFYPRQVHCFSSAGSLSKQVEQMQRRNLHLLVVTPSRLEELVRIPIFQQNCEKRLKLLVLDEAEKLSSPWMTIGLNRLPACPTWVFASQCVPMPRIADPLWMDPLRVIRQRVMVAGYNKQWLLLLEILRQAHSGPVVVFVPTPRLYLTLFRQLTQRPLSDTKLNSPRGVLFTDRASDIYQADLVVQVGSPKSREVYLDRLNKAQEGVLILAPFEKDFLEKLTDQPLQKIRPHSFLPEDVRKVREASDHIALTLGPRKLQKHRNNHYTHYKKLYQDSKIANQAADDFLDAIDNKFY